MTKLRVANGIWWVSIPESGLSVLCGCPADSVKHLFKRGLISTAGDGTAVETGPNAVLLSDTAVQGGAFANLAEFPVLQMLYRQGMMGLPARPGESSQKPILIGVDSQLNAQSRYILRGNYGLFSREELMAAGAAPELADTILRMKLKYAFGKLQKVEDILELVPVASESVPLRPGTSIRRRAFNTYEFVHGGSSLLVDLNLGPGEAYEPAYSLPPRRIRREYFSVVHTGDGDGWSADKPCMGSLLTYQGRIFLVDAGPFVEESLTALGVGINEVEGIFQTHAHDDHFAGLTSLVHADHRIKYFATPPVRASVAKKLSALMDFNESRFSRYFEVVDLAMDAWNDIDGLEVKPVLSAHPVETTVLYFRTHGPDGPVTYGHLADIPTFASLRGMVTTDLEEPGVSAAFADRLQETLLSQVHLKKIDIGGGAIHGAASDFRGDKSRRIVLSHFGGEPSDAQKEVGSTVSFGQQDILVSSNEDYLLAQALGYLVSYFPVAMHDLRMLLNCPRSTFAAGTLILRKGDTHGELHLVLDGVVEFLDREAGIRGRMAAGGMVGEYSSLHRIAAIRTFRAVSEVSTLRIPNGLYEEFLRRTGLADETRRVLENRQFLQDTPLFCDMVSFPVLRDVAARGVADSLVAGQPATVSPGLHMVQEGLLELVDGDRKVETLHRGSFFGEDLLLVRRHVFETRAVTGALILSIPPQSVRDIPVVQWHLLETLERRLMSAAKKGPH